METKITKKEWQELYKPLLWALLPTIAYITGHYAITVYVLSWLIFLIALRQLNFIENYGKGK
jgi:hypothetical protein